MATNTVEKELLQLEKQYWQAIQDKDADAAARLTDDPCLVAGAQGVGLIDKKTLRTMLTDAKYTLLDYRFDGEPQVRLITDDVAVVAYKVHEDLTVDGKPVALDASDASTWVRRQGHWVCALHTESIAGDPFGRDRQQSK